MKTKEEYLPWILDNVKGHTNEWIVAQIHAEIMNVNIKINDFLHIICIYTNIRKVIVISGRIKLWDWFQLKM